MVTATVQSKKQPFELELCDFGAFIVLLVIQLSQNHTFSENKMESLLN